MLSLFVYFKCEHFAYFARRTCPKSRILLVSPFCCHTVHLLAHLYKEIHYQSFIRIQTSTFMKKIVAKLFFSFTLNVLLTGYEASCMIRHVCL